MPSDARKWTENRIIALLTAIIVVCVVGVLLMGFQRESMDSDLAQAASKREYGRAEQLIQAGANVNAEFEWPGTVLDGAVENDDLEMAELLLKHGANPMVAVDHEGRTVFDLARTVEMKALLERYRRKIH